MFFSIKYSTGLIFFSVVIISLNSCQMSVSFNGGSTPAGAENCSVKMFQTNATLAPPTLSQSFTEALKDLLLAQTRLDLIQKDGDLHYEGSISGYTISPLAVQEGETAALNRLTITVQYRYVNTLEEDKTKEGTISRFADYESSQSLSDVEQTLIADINSQLVQDIYNQTLGDW